MDFRGSIRPRQGRAVAPGKEGRIAVVVCPPRDDDEVAEDRDGGRAVHEAGAVRAAIHKVVRGWPPGRTTGCLRLEIVDATRANAEAVGFYATAILGDMGLRGVDVSVHTRELICDSCATAVVPELAHPICESCGAPLRSRPGLAIVASDQTTGVATDTSGGPRQMEGLD
jgi:hypothetical protein